MRIKTKLVGFVAGALVVPLLLGVFYVRHFGRLYYLEQQGLVHRMIAEELAGTLHEGVQQKFEQVLNWVALSSIPSLAAEVPGSPFSLANIEQVESTWLVSAEVDGVLKTILSNPLAGSIGAFQRVNPEFAEILMTDRHGRVIGATNPTTDYWQADEAWWKTASALPSGTGVIEGLLYDESAGVLAIDMAFPVYRFEKPASFIGVLKVSLDATRFLQRAAPFPWNKAISRDLIFSDGRVFVHIDSGRASGIQQILGGVLRKLLAEPDGWATVELRPGTLSLAAAVPVKIMTRLSVSGEGSKDPRELYAVVSRDLNEAMMPVRDVLRQLTFWGVVAALLVASISYWLATCWFARPIKKLRNASQSFVNYIQQGEQGRFENLWESRKQARQRLNDLETIQSQDELQDLSRDFIRMGERMLTFLRLLEKKQPDDKKE
ncbi:MAG: cache domain-containing protein [Verrucomicrobia bacterium]|nr:cache domain-containing protein [Verrucomicrobiota bacterium]